MRLAVVGTRTFHDYELLKSYLAQVWYMWGIDVIVTGDAKGADELAKKYAQEYDIPLLVFRADWDKYGKSAGPIRNAEIVKAADTLIAFWDGKSKGTKNSIAQAKALGLLVIEIELKPKSQQDENK